jgi:hypothetical protein
MRRVLAIVWCGLGLGLAAPAVAPAAGGPVPPQQGGAGVSAPGSDIAYVALPAGRDRTVVERVRRGGSGGVERSRLLRGSLGVPGVAWDGSSTGLSADGRTLVLGETISRYPVKRTRFTVLDTQRLRPRASISLPGFFTLDAVSPDGRWLYLIHYASARNTNRYEVRAYDLLRRQLVRRPVIDPREPDEAMQGTPVTRAISADGRWAYTLYIRGDEPPFIHALDTQGRTAVCVDLPQLTAPPGDGRLTLTDGGRTLEVDSQGEPVVLVDTRTFEVRRPAAPAAPRPPAPHQEESSPGGGTSWLLVLIPLAVLTAVALASRRSSRRGRRRAATMAGGGFEPPKA